MPGVHPQRDLRLFAVAAEGPLPDEKAHKEAAIEVG
jgi:hypothetical protein